MKSFLRILFLLFVANANAQIADKSLTKYLDRIKISELKETLNIIAGPSMEGRETGTSGQIKASQFIADYYKQIGLMPGNNGSYFQYYPLIKDSLINGILDINGQQFKYGNDYVIPLSINTNETINTIPELPMEVVWGGYGIVDSNYNNLSKIDVQDKALLVLSGEPRSSDTTFLFTHNQKLNESKELYQIDSSYILSHTQKPSKWSGFTLGTKLRAQAAAKLGVRILFIVDTSNSWSNKVTFPICLPQNAEDSISINVYIISKEIAQTITGNNFEMLEHFANKVIPADFHTYISLYASQLISHQNIQASNVMAYLSGTDKKDELVIVSAHYDHLGMRNGKIYFGADDNGSGTTAVLEMAKAFAIAKTNGKNPRRSILFLNVSGEEEQLWGSDFYTTHPVFPITNTIVDLNTDMIGRTDMLHNLDDKYLYIIGDDKLSSSLRAINEANNKVYSKLFLDYKYNDPKEPERIYYRSDHYNFAKNKVPVIFFFDGINTDYHKITDTPDKINYELMYQRMKLIFSDVWSLANRDEKLPIDRNEK